MVDLKKLFNNIFKKREPKLPKRVLEFRERQIKYQRDTENLYLDGTEPQEVVYCLADVFLGENWYCPDPLPTKQINSIILHEILTKYCKGYVDK